MATTPAPLFAASIDATGSIVTVVSAVDTTVAVDVTFLGQVMHLAQTATPVLSNDSDGKTWKLTATSADGLTFTFTRS